MLKFNVDKLPCKIASEVNDIDCSKFTSKKNCKRFDRYIQLAIAASRLALFDSGIKVNSYDPFSMGVIVASGVGGIETVERQMINLKDKGPRYVSPYLIPSFITNMASGIVGIDLKVKGINFSITSACASSTHAIGEAFNKVKYGDVDIIFAGGSEASVTELGFAGFCSMKAMSSKFNDKPSTASRPFNYDRGGFVMGEGAVVLVIESLKSALSRGAGVYCEVSSYSSNSDSFHITTPDPTYVSLKACYVKGLGEGFPLSNVDYINLHGTSTKYNDSIESRCVRSLLNPEFGKGRVGFFDNPVCSSTKSMTGHLLGSTGALEAAVCALSTLNNIIPPTINYCLPDEDCGLFYNPNRLTVREVNKSLNVSIGFGGHNAILVFKKFVL